MRQTVDNRPTRGIDGVVQLDRDRLIAQRTVVYREHATNPDRSSSWRRVTGVCGGVRCVM
jgi:hypothetical protein